MNSFYTLIALTTFYFFFTPGKCGVAGREYNNWPTYKHSFSTIYREQLCYKCPPGFYLYEQCEFSRDPEKNPGQSKCLPCPSNTFSQRWNTDDRCWDHQKCTGGRVEIHNGGSTGPTLCACPSSKILKNGRCVNGISKTSYDLEVRRLMSKIQTLNNNIASMRTTTTTASTTTTTATTSKASTTSESNIVEAPLIFINTENEEMSLSEGTQKPVTNVVPTSTLLIFVSGTVLGICLLSIVVIVVFKVMKRPKKGQNKENNRQDDIQANSADVESPIIALQEADMIGENDKRKLLPKDTDKYEKHDERENDMLQENKAKRESKTSRDTADAQVFEDIDNANEQPEGMAKAELIESNQDTNSSNGKDIDEWDVVIRIFQSKIFTENSWYFLARHVLELHSDIISRIKGSGGTWEDKVKQAVRSYIESKSAQATIQNVLKSLQRHKYISMRDEIMQELGIENKDKNIPIDKLDRACAIVEYNMPPKRVSVFCRVYLGLDQNELEKLKQATLSRREENEEVVVDGFYRCPRQMSRTALYHGDLLLKLHSVVALCYLSEKNDVGLIRDGLATWRQQNGVNATVGQLLEYLTKFGQAHIATLIGEEFESQAKTEQGHIDESPEDEDKAGPIDKQNTGNGTIREATHPTEQSAISPTSTSLIAQPSADEISAVGGAGRGSIVPDSLPGPSHGSGIGPMDGHNRGNGTIRETIHPTGQSAISLTGTSLISQPPADEVSAVGRAEEGSTAQDSLPGPSHDSESQSDSCKGEKDEGEIMDIDNVNDKPDQDGKGDVDNSESDSSEDFNKDERTIPKAKGDRPIATGCDLKKTYDDVDTSHLLMVTKNNKNELNNTSNGFSNFENRKMIHAAS